MAAGLVDGDTCAACAAGPEIETVPTLPTCHACGAVLYAGDDGLECGACGETLAWVTELPYARSHKPHAVSVVARALIGAVAVGADESALLERVRLAGLTGAGMILRGAESKLLLKMLQRGG